MSTRFPQLPALLTTLVLACVASGCLIGTSSKTKYTGRYISQETLKQIEPGESPDDVFALLGEPTSRIQKESGKTIWKYAYTQATTKSGAVFLLVGSEKTTEIEGAVYVEFDAEKKVVKTWSER